jgi:hypothetical protein
MAQGRKTGGRRKGSLNKATARLRQLLEGHTVEELLNNEAPEVWRRVITAAKAGDMQAAALHLRSIVPAARSRRVGFKLPPMNCLADLTHAHDLIDAAQADGILTLEEAGQLAERVEQRRRVYETVELEQRLARLEQLGDRGPLIDYAAPDARILPTPSVAAPEAASAPPAAAAVHPTAEPPVRPAPPSAAPAVPQLPPEPPPLDSAPWPANRYAPAPLPPRGRVRTGQRLGSDDDLFWGRQ